MFRLTLRARMLIRDTLIALVIGILGAAVCWKFLAVTVPEVLLLLYSFSFGAWILVIGTNPVYPRMKKHVKREGFIDG